MASKKITDYTRKSVSMGFYSLSNAIELAETLIDYGEQISLLPELNNWHVVVMLS
ncbi:MAG: hypothetical protein ACFFC7_13330 [Candidatus Hermodarchaeota archaeon]